MTITHSGSWTRGLVTMVAVVMTSLCVVIEALPRQHLPQPAAQHHFGTASVSTTTPSPLVPVVMVKDVVTSCSRDISGTAKTQGDGGYRIRVIGLHQPTYLPGGVYTVEVGGTYSGQMMAGFTLVSVPRFAQDESTEMGVFQHFDHGDSDTMFDPVCPHHVTNVTSVSVSSVSLLWTAPLSGAGCLEFRATVVASDGRWYRDDGALTVPLCESSSNDPSLDQTTTYYGDVDARRGRVERAAEDDVKLVADDDDEDAGVATRKSSTDQGQGEGQKEACCICASAKYQLTFESLWSGSSSSSQQSNFRNALRHWSSTMGASHGPAYSMWRFEDYASGGVEQLCELGHVQALERELRHHDDDVGTVIKMPAMSWNEQSGLEQSRWAHFTADRHKHLLSTVTRLGPSPDWCVGVSALDLCLPNCTWAQNLSVDLYLWDAGTNDGSTFLAPRLRSSPPRPISRLTKNSGSLPFPATSQLLLQPVAVLHVTRVAGGDKLLTSGDTLCENVEAAKYSSVSESIDSLSAELLAEKCQVSEWTTWTRCSVTCGLGISARKRTLVSGSRLVCGRLPMVETHTCYGAVAQCVSKPPDVCAVSDWSEWSACSVSCGKGVRGRRRSYAMSGPEVTRCNRVIDERESCDMDTAQCVRLMAAKNFSAICRQPADGGSCGGSQLLWYYNPALLVCMPFAYGGCQGNDNRFFTELECVDICTPAVTTRRVPPNTVLVNSSATTTISGLALKISIRSATTPATSNVIANVTRPWPLSSIRHGRTTTSQLPTATQTVSSSSTVTSSSSSNSNDGMRRVNDSPKVKVKHPSVVHCQLTDWGAWSVCSSTCGASFKFRRRQVLQPAANGGQSCPRTLKMRRRCNVPACPTAADCEMSEWSPWSRCTVSCGPRAVQQRIRRPLNHGNPKKPLVTGCEVQVDRRRCRSLPSCTWQRIMSKRKSVTSST